MKLEVRKAAERRHTILELLIESGGHASESELMTALLACAYGFDYLLTEDVVRADLDWLRRRNLVTTSMILGTMMEARITRAGSSAVLGRVPVEGLLKPVAPE